MSKNGNPQLFFFLNLEINVYCICDLTYLQRSVVGVLVRREESAPNLAAVRVLPLAVEDFVVEVDVVHVDGTVEGDGDHLRHLVGLDVARDAGAVGGAEAVGQHALRGVAVRRAVRVVLHRCTAITIAIR